MGHLNIVLLLLQNGASPDIRNIVSKQEEKQLKLVHDSLYCFFFLHTSAVRRPYTWQHEQVRWKWFAVCWGTEPWLTPWPEWVPSLHLFIFVIILTLKRLPNFIACYSCLCFVFFYFHDTHICTPLTPSQGGPDPPPHCLPFRQNRHRPAVAAAHGPPRRRHHQRLHAPSHLSQGRPGWDRCRPTGSWGLALDGYEGKCLATFRRMKSRLVEKNAFSPLIQPHCDPVG